MNPYCCGIIIFNNNLAKTVLVETHREWKSFPKGKREKGETDMECAVREVEEETGLLVDNLNISEQYLDEPSNKGNGATRYFVAQIINDNVKFKYDQNELKSVKWHGNEEIDSLIKFKPVRKEVFKQVLQLAKSLFEN